MTQFSMFWTTTPAAAAVGDGSAPYTTTNWFDFLRRTLINDNTTQGVIAGFLNDLAVTGAASPLSVNTGAAVVYGIPYQNDASVSLTVATPVVGNTGGHVILRADWAAQTVRLVAVRNTDGNAATPTLTQVAGTTWEVRLATFIITTLGVITLTDAREYCRFNTSLIHRRQGGDLADWADGGSTNYRIGPLRIQVGVAIWGGFASSGSVAVTFPVAFSERPWLLSTAAGEANERLSGTYDHTTLSNTGATLAWRTSDGSNWTSVWLPWVAIGPV